MRYYLHNSAAFDHLPYEYNTEVIKDRVEAAGGSKVRVSRAFGWYNQPDIVTWEGDEAVNRQIGLSLSRMPPFSGASLPCPIIHECDRR